MHRLDPRAKILALIFLVVSVFLVESPWAFLVIAIFMSVVVSLSRLPLRSILRGFRPMIWIFVSIMILHILFADEVFRPTLDSVYSGLRVGFRFLLIVLAAVTLTLTTVPLQLADGMALMLNPLRKIGLPVHQFPIMTVIVLHFIPALFEEAEKLVMAQKARGAKMDDRNIVKRLMALTPILVPLLRSSFRHADELALGMEARCYDGGIRGHLHALKFKMADSIALALSAAMIPLALKLNGLVI